MAPESAIWNRSALVETINSADSPSLKCQLTKCFTRFDYGSRRHFSQVLLCLHLSAFFFSFSLVLVLENATRSLQVTSYRRARSRFGTVCNLFGSMNLVSQKEQGFWKCSQGLVCMGHAASALCCCGFYSCLLTFFFLQATRHLRNGISSIEL